MAWATLAERVVTVMVVILSAMAFAAAALQWLLARAVRVLDAWAAVADQVGEVGAAVQRLRAAAHRAHARWHPPTLDSTSASVD